MADEDKSSSRLRPEDQDFCCLANCGVQHIQHVELRGIQPLQLLALVSFMKSKCDAEGAIQGWYDDFSKLPKLYLKQVNLYQVAHWVIKPLTVHAKVSYVEAVSLDPEAQKPIWFVSHWWGEAVVDFVACLCKHQSTRGLPAETAYWVCAYANNQHELGADLGTDPMESSFLKAMKLSEGVLLVLDPEATAFTRIWCCFEEGVVTLAARGLLEGSDAHSADRASLKELVARDGQAGRKAPLVLDIATVDEGGETQLITEGLTDKEQEQENEHAAASELTRRLRGRKSGWDRKSEREAHFPITLIKRGLSVNITGAQASQAIDKTRILNALAGKRGIVELDTNPDEDAEVYAIINAALHSSFALSAWRLAVERGLDISDTGELPLVRALWEDSARLEVTLHLSGCSSLGSVAELGSGLQGLQSLQQLTLNLKYCSGLSSVAELGSGLQGLQSLQQLTLDLSSCSSLSIVAELGSGLQGLQSLQQLTLNLGGCSSLESVAGLEGLHGLQSLQQLALSLRNCFSLDSVAELGSGLQGLQSLQQLTLDLSSCSNLGNVAELGSGLQGLQSLQQLTLDLSSCSSLSSVAELGSGLQGLQSLQQLTLNLDVCPFLESVTELGLGLQGLQSLQLLTLNLGGCSSLSSVAGLEGLQGLQSLQHLTMDLSYCSSLGSVAELRSGLQGLQSLQQLTLNLGDCSSLESVTELGSGLQGLQSLQQLMLILGGCSSLSSVAGLEGLQGLQSLQHLTVDLKYCSSLSSVAELGSGLQGLQSLQQLTLNLSNCSSLSSVAELGSGLQGLQSLQHLTLDLGDCSSLRIVAVLGEKLQCLQSLRQLSVTLPDGKDVSNVADLKGSPLRTRICMLL